MPVWSCNSSCCSAQAASSWYKRQAWPQTLRCQRGGHCRHFAMCAEARKVLMCRWVAQLPTASAAWEV
eukprot:12931163-Prorocentrum_lima.AAC.1